MQIRRVASHLFYWGKVTMVYPVCTSNLYVLSGYVPDPLSRHLQDKFTDKFPGEELEHYLKVGGNGPIKVIEYLVINLRS